MSCDRFEYANYTNLTYIENLYAEYLKNPSHVDPSWQRFFEGMAFGAELQKTPFSQTGGEKDEMRVTRLIDAYRTYGYLAASFNPLDPHPPKIEQIPHFNLEKMGFSLKEQKNSFPTLGLLKEKRASLEKMIEVLQNIYTGYVGYEYMFIASSEVKTFIQKKIETQEESLFSKQKKIDLFSFLYTSETFETFIHRNYPGQTRFSIEGGETLLPMLKELIDQAGEKGIENIVMGMSHRGRLNVLAHIFHKSYRDIFYELEPHYQSPSFEMSDDVAYHKGDERTIETEKKQKVHLSLIANASHLESNDPIVEGMSYAYSQKNHQGNAKKVLPLLLHGDASVAGQGVVYEVMQFAKIKGYKTGGTIHIVVNNHVGFTANPYESRSTFFATDLAKAFEAPIFHVNAEDPESCMKACVLALLVRQEFGCDVFIDFNCYRKYGHNEGDEPRFTQPLLYHIIQKKEKICDIYKNKVMKEGLISEEEIGGVQKEVQKKLEAELKIVKKEAKTEKEIQHVDKKAPFSPQIETGVSLEILKKLGEKCFCIPKEFRPYPKIKRIFEDRLKMLNSDPKEYVVDWALAEYLAYATLLTENISVRISGQDSGRGTFSHRHAILTDQEDETLYLPLCHLQEEQASFGVYNSPLSEYGILGFEYGYSLVSPYALTIWEAQYGDFANGAQIIIDQYLVSGEQKWKNISSLTLLLPHGYEGAGPEHSSGRLERFLQLAATRNLCITMITTASQFFHLLRRQGLDADHKPLIIFTPKKMLRFIPSLSCLKDFETGTSFQEVIDDPYLIEKAKRLLFCSGKVYYDLAEEREKRKEKEIALIRIEQLYPLNLEEIKKILDKYQGFKECLWVQEEHRNMGAWEFISHQFKKLLPENIHFRYVGRKRSASTATGSKALHRFEFAKFLNEAFES